MARKIYILKEKGTTYYKIGQSYTPEQRFSNLQSGNPRELLVIDTINNTAAVSDGIFKKEFKKFYANGGGGTEWYKIPKKEIDKVRRRIKQLCKKKH